MGEFNMFDVGGQRNERKKWIHAFDNVTAVIFVAAINEYDQVLFEDNKVNRIDEALELFRQIADERAFEQIDIILFLNKSDLFREKLGSHPFRVEGERFMDFDGPHCVPGEPSANVGTPEYEACYNAALQYLVNRFLSQDNNKNRHVYHKVTCATDEDNVRTVFNATRDIVLRDVLQDTLGVSGVSAK